MRVLAAMARFKNISFHFLCAGNGSVEIIEFKPKEYAISIRFYFGFTKGTVMVLDVPVVQLKDQCSIRQDESFILLTTVIASKAKESLIPPATRLDVMYANEGV